MPVETSNGVWEESGKIMIFKIKSWWDYYYNYCYYYYFTFLILKEFPLYINGVQRVNVWLCFYENLELAQREMTLPLQCGLNFTSVKTFSTDQGKKQQQPCHLEICFNVNRDLR